MRNCSLTQLHVFKLDVDIYAEHALVLNPSVLGYHQNVLFHDQVLDNVLQLLGQLQGCLQSLLALVEAVFQFKLLHQSVYDVGLRY